MTRFHGPAHRFSAVSFPVLALVISGTVWILLVTALESSWSVFAGPGALGPAVATALVTRSQSETVRA